MTTAHEAMLRICGVLVATLSLICAATPVAAQARQTVTLAATLTPEILGQGTTLGFGFEIKAPHGHVPSPVETVDLSYPNDLGIALSGLGLETCRPATLEARGLKGCPADSLMGSGEATVAIPVGPTVVREQAGITIVRAPVRDGRFALIFYAEGTSPVEAQLQFPALLLTAREPFGGRVDIRLPLVPSLPEAPDVAMTRLQSTLGPEHLTYYERAHGHTISYHPRGIRLPKACPRGGFPFAAKFTFQDGTHSIAHTVVPCPS
jgi:hypothetical protein